MLVLSRRENEKIIAELPDGRIVELMVIDIRQDAVRIGIEAPKDIEIRRPEMKKGKR